MLSRNKCQKGHSRGKEFHQNVSDEGDIFFEIIGDMIIVKVEKDKNYVSICLKVSRIFIPNFIEREFVIPSKEVNVKVKGEHALREGTPNAS